MWPTLAKVEPPKEPQHCPKCGVLMGVPPRADVLCPQCFYGDPSERRGLLHSIAGNRLAGGDDLWQAREIEVLASFGDAIVSELTRIMRMDFGPVGASAARVLGRIGTDSALNALLCHLSECLQRQRYMRWMRRWFRLAVAVLVGGTALTMIRHSTPPEAWGICLRVFVGASLLWMSWHDPEAKVRNQVAESLAALESPRAAGVLARARSDKRLRDAVAPVLARTLPKVTEEIGAGFGKPERAAILALLTAGDLGLLRAALTAVATFGAEDAVHPVEMLISSLRPTIDLTNRHAERDAGMSVEGHLDPSVRLELASIQGSGGGRALAGIGDLPRRDRGRVSTEDWEELLALAERTLAAVEARAERDRERQSLLRSSSAPTGDNETLLRPAVAQPDPEPQQLLRRADDDPQAQPLGG